MSVTEAPVEIVLVVVPTEPVAAPEPDVATLPTGSVVRRCPDCGSGYAAATCWNC